MGLLGRYFSERDLNIINSFNAELMGDIIQTLVTIHKICPDQTRINIYGETSPQTGNVYYPGIEITAIINRADIETNYDDFGPDREQSVIFAFREKMLKQFNLFPEVGDLILFNERYHECDNVVQEQFLGGIDDKSHSIICHTNYTRLSKISLVERQV